MWRWDITECKKSVNPSSQTMQNQQVFEPLCLSLQKWPQASSHVVSNTVFENHKKCLILAKMQNLLVLIKKCDIFRSFSNSVFLLQIYKLNVLLAKNIISKGRGFLEQNVNLTETPAVSKPQKFKICGTADFAKNFFYNLFCIFEKWVKLQAMVMINFGTKIVIVLMYRVSHQVFSNVLKLTKS